MKILRVSLQVLAYLCLIFVAVLTVLTRTHSAHVWAFDLLTSFYLQFVFIFAGIFLFFIFLKDGLGLILGGFSLLLISPFFLPYVFPLFSHTKEDTQPLRVMQYNLFTENLHVRPLISWLKEESPAEILAFQEVSSRNARELLFLSESYPYHSSYKEMKRSGLAIFSKVPLHTHKLMALPRVGYYFLRISGKYGEDKKPFVLYNVHFFSPVSEKRWLYRNQAMEFVARRVQKEAAPYRIIVGDFNVANASPWFQRLRELAEMRDAQEGSGFLQSWSLFPDKPWWGSTLIDQALISPNITCLDRENGKDFGSDHLPVINIFSLQ